MSKLHIVFWQIQQNEMFMLKIRSNICHCGTNITFKLFFGDIYHRLNHKRTSLKEMLFSYEFITFILTYILMYCVLKLFKSLHFIYLPKSCSNSVYSKIFWIFFTFYRSVPWKSKQWWRRQRWICQHWKSMSRGDAVWRVISTSNWLDFLFLLNRFMCFYV